jgi:hypothetical protein
MDRERYTDAIVYHEAHHSTWTCTACGVNDGFFRCQQCFDAGLWCRDCCLDAHQRHPFHHVQHWNGVCFDRIDLNTLGFVIYCGHKGSPCPRVAVADRLPAQEEHGGDATEPQWEDFDNVIGGNSIQIGSTNGIFVRQILWCECSEETGSPLPKDIQLLRLRLYPATPHSPATAFHFDCLKDFHLQTVECKTAAQKYLAKLRRMTSDTAPDLPPVRHSLLWSEKD